MQQGKINFRRQNCYELIDQTSTKNHRRNVKIINIQSSEHDTIKYARPMTSTKTKLFIFILRIKKKNQRQPQSALVGHLGINRT